MTELELQQMKSSIYNAASSGQWLKTQITNQERLIRQQQTNILLLEQTVGELQEAILEIRDKLSM